jgi:hypothetical protein
MQTPIAPYRSVEARGIPFPCVVGEFGHIQTFIGQVPLGELIDFLGHDPRPRGYKAIPEDVRALYDQIQGSRMKGSAYSGRRGDIEDYLEQRLIARHRVAIFPPITVAAVTCPNFVENPNTPGMGTAYLPADLLRVLLDGLGRVGGGLDWRDKHPELRAANAPLHVYYGVMLISPMPGKPAFTADELKTLFVDPNFRVRPVSPAHVISLASDDIYIDLARRLTAADFIAKHGGVETKAASLGKRSTAVATLQQLMRMVRGATEGAKFQESNLERAEEPRLTNATFDEISEKIATWFDTLALLMGERWADGPPRRSIHLSSAGWQAMGVIFHDAHYAGLELNEAQRNKILRELAAIDYSREGELAKTIGLSGGAGRTNRQALIDELRRRTNLGEMLTEKAPAA